MTYNVAVVLCKALQTYIILGKPAKRKPEKSFFRELFPGLDYRDKTNFLCFLELAAYFQQVDAECDNVLRLLEYREEYHIGFLRYRCFAQVPHFVAFDVRYVAYDIVAFVVDEHVVLVFLFYSFLAEGEERHDAV